MAKTRKSRQQMSNVAIKQEEEDVKDIQLLHRVNTTAGNNNNKITKPKPPKNKNSQEIKIEQDIDIKTTLEAPANDPRHEPPARSQEQINRFIDYVFNQNMSVTKASYKLKMHSDKAFYYYHMHMNDPEKKLPLLVAPANRRVNTQEEVNTLIRLIVNDKVSVMEAAVKANMTRHTARYYHRRYLADPNHNIPSLYAPPRCPQEKVDEVLGYLVDKKMTITAASEKANVSTKTASKYFRKYLNENNMCAPKSIYATSSPDNVQKLIGYIVDKKMTIKAASAKANMCTNTGNKYYKQYLIKNNLIDRRNVNTCTQDQIDSLISLIVDDKMTIKDASKKTKMNYTTGRKYYQRYVKDQQQSRPSGCDGGASNDEMDPINTNEQSCHQILDAPAPNNLQCTQDQINKLISCMVDQKLPLSVASQKANMSKTTAQKYYRLYLNGQKHATPASSTQPCSPDKIQQLYSYIFDDKMSITAASIKVGMNAATARKYYNKFINDHNLTDPPHITRIRPHSQEKIQELIHYLVDEKMTLAAASKKAKMSKTCSRKHYRRYLKAQKSVACRTPQDSRTCRPCTQETINQLIGYIVDDKMSVKAASKLANVSYSTGKRYYADFVADPKHAIPTARHLTCQPAMQEKLNALIGYIIDDKMTIVAASRKAKISYDSGKRYYRKYKRQLSTPKTLNHSTQYTQDQISAFIHSIINEKITIKAAAVKANIGYYTAKKCYRQYRKDTSS